MNLQLMDTAKARIQDSNGKYHYKDHGKGESSINSQEIFLQQSIRQTLGDD